MEFWASAEVHQPADHALERVRRCIEPRLQAALNRSALTEVKIKLRYVPIVMPAHMYERYPDRSKALAKKGICDCAPHLDYDTFVNGGFEQQIKEYVRGIETSHSYLRKLGMTSGQLADLSDVLNDTLTYALLACPDRVRS